MIISLLFEKQLNIYIYYLFVSQPLPVESPAAATELERVAEKQRESLCLEAVIRHGQAVWCVAQSRYSGHSPPFTLIERINQPITVTHTLTWPLYWPLIGQCDPVQVSNWLILVHSDLLVLSGLVSGHHSPARVKSSIGKCKKYCVSSKTSNYVFILELHWHWNFVDLDLSILNIS